MTKNMQRVVLLSNERSSPSECLSSCFSSESKSETSVTASQGLFFFSLSTGRQRPKVESFSSLDIYRLCTHRFSADGTETEFPS